MSGEYSTVKPSRVLIDEIKSSLQNVEGWGSVEIFVQDSEVTQITVRKIKKTRKNGLRAKNGVHNRDRSSIGS